MVDVFPSLLIFLFGLIIGSFLNCLIYRLEVGQSFLTGRSYCEKCKHILAWRDLIPVVSFLALKGKCRYCQKKISWQYPLVEIATGALFFLIFNLKFKIFNQFLILNFLNLIYYWAIACFFIIIFVYDLKHYIIPDKVVYPAIAISVFYQLFRILNLGFVSGFEFRASNFGPLINPLASALFALTLFFLIFLLSGGRWLGLGDVKLAFLMGLILGFPNILLALFLAFVFGAIIGVGLIVCGKKNLKSEVPFAPFLVASTLVAIFWAEKAINWYLNLFF